MIPKLFVLGDSISLGYGPYLAYYLRHACVYDRKGGPNPPIVTQDDTSPQGANGGDSAMVRDYLQTRLDADDFHADYLLLNCGLHDIKITPGSNARQVSLDAYGDNLQAVIDLLWPTETEIIWVRTTPVDTERHNQLNPSFYRFDEDVQEYNALADAIFEDVGCPVIDLYTFTLSQGEDLYADHVHFNEWVRQQQAALIAGYLLALME